MTNRKIHLCSGPRAHAAFGRCGGSGMARSRRLWNKGGVVVAFAGLIILSILTGQVTLSNGIVEDRASIAALEADRDYLKTRIGLLELDWNRETTRNVILVRAEEELGLEPAAGPPEVLVAGTNASRSRISERPRGRSRWLATASAATTESRP